MSTALSTRLTTLAFVALSLSACDENLLNGAGQADLERSFDSPEVLEITRDVPVYRTECQSYSEYGPDASCGSYQVCSHHHSVHDRFRHATGEPHTHHGSPNGPSTPGTSHGHGGHHGDHHHDPVVTCSTHYHSCQHVETSCTQVFDHTTHATLRLRFDPEAKLLPGEKEKIKLSLSGAGATKTLQIAVEDSRYVYDLKEMFVIDMSGAETTKEVFVKATAMHQPRAVHNLEIVSANYTDEESFEVRLKDPFAGVREIGDSIYHFEVEGFAWFKLISVDVRASELTREGDVLVYRLHKGQDGWKRDPKVKKKGKEYDFRSSVKRETRLFQDKFSEEKELKILFKS